ncbi:MAG: GtrA family protein [Lachnospiraceae bacterium]|nr:GtrA family protein [Lachnospiraceae bacterium]
MEEKQKGSKEAVRVVKFALFSTSAGIIEMAVFSLLNEFTEFAYWPCYLTALVMSVLWNFTLNRKFTFKSANNVPKAMFLVACFYAVFTPVTTLLGNYLAEDLQWNEYLVTILNMALNLTTEYIYDRYVVFKDTIDTNIKTSEGGEVNE